MWTSFKKVGLIQGVWWEGQGSTGRGGIESTVGDGLQESLVVFSEHFSEGLSPRIFNSATFKGYSKKNNF